MSLNITITSQGTGISTEEGNRITYHLGALDRQLIHHPDPRAVLAICRHSDQRSYDVSLTLELGQLGGHLVSHQLGASVDQAVRLAAEDIAREMERQHASRRCEPGFGVPS